MNCFKLYLEFENDDAGNLIQIDEPKGFNGLTINLETPEEKYFGRNLSYGGGSINLEFLSTFQGMDLGHQFDRLLEYWYCYGYNSCVKLYVEECEENILIGRLNFEAADTDGCSYFSTEIIEEQKANVLLERLETNVDIKSTDTLNGEPGKTAEFIDVCLKTKIFEEIGRQENEDFNDPNAPSVIDNLQVTSIALASQAFYALETANKDALSDLNIQNNLPFLNGIDNVDENGSNKFVYSFGETGTVNLTYDFNNCITVYEIISPGTLPTNYNIDLELIVQHRRFDDANVQFITIPLYVFDESMDGTPQIVNASDLSGLNFNVLQGDKIYIYYRYKLPITITDDRNWDIEHEKKVPSFHQVTYQSFTADSQHKLIRIKDLICKQVDNISDGCVNVEMPEFCEDGKYYDYALANGYEVRLFEDRPLFYDLERMLEGLNMIFAVGYQVCDDEIFIGTVKQFYKAEKSGELLFQPVEYKESIDDRFAINTVKIQYNKRAKNEVNTIDDIHTKSEYNIPNNKVTGNCKFETDLIGSGYLSELTRRKQFQDTATESDGNDDELFIYDIVFDATLNKYVNRTLEDINVTPGTLISPETSYNISLSPLQIFSRWWCYLGSSLGFKTDNENIKTTFFESNGSMESEVLDSCSFTDLAPQNFELNKSVFPTPIFTPIKVESTLLGVTLTDVNNLITQVRKDRGYHCVLDAKGNEEQIYITEFEYNICNQELKLTGTKKNPDYNG